MDKREIKQLKHPKEIRLNEVELVKFQLSYILRAIDISDTELYTLSYMYVYEEDVPSLMVKEGKIKREKSVENIISKFRKKGIIQGKGIETRLHPNIRPFIGDLDFTIKLRLNQS